MFFVRHLSTKYKWLFSPVMALTASVIVSCSAAQDDSTGDNMHNSQNNLPAMANPAAAKCVNHGYELVPVIKNGVPVESFCVNPENGKKCEVWRYFRDECSLND